MAVRALALSGGAARGSFQLGAIVALYDVYGFRPDVIAGTSVGAVNGVMLAQARPPAVNDPAAILAAVAAGAPDPGITAVRRLEAEWATFQTFANFLTIQPAFAGTVLEGAAAGALSPAPGAGAPISATIGGTIDLFSVLLSIPILNLFTGPIAGVELQSLKRTVMGVLTENAIFNMDPIAMRLNDTTKLDPTVLPAGTPIYLAMVALESGRLRYVDGTGTFTERDGSTPVLTALMNSDIDAALDENLQRLAPARAAVIKGLNDRFRAAVAAIATARASFADTTTSAAQRTADLRSADRNKERGDYLLGVLRTQLAGVRVRTSVAVPRAVLASAALPVFSDPIVIGAERYIDGGLREIIPMEIAARRGVTEVVGICCSTLELPETGDMSHAGLADVGLRALSEIALQEITFDDIAAVRRQGMSCTVIAPSFDVHGGIEVETTLIGISRDYGWMRACDEMQPLTDEARADARRLSDLITTFRLATRWVEGGIDGNESFSLAASTRDPVVRIRLYRWMIRELLAARAALGLPAHPKAVQWWRDWTGGAAYFGSSSVWSQLSVYSTNRVEVRIADAVADPATFAPDAGALIDGGNDRVHWIVRGARFPSTTETEGTTTRTPALVVPHAAIAALPRVPRGDHLIAEQSTPNDVWIVHRGRRFHANATLIGRAGLTGATVAIVPDGGLAQIIDGGPASWLGGLIVADSNGVAVDLWTPTPQIEGRSATTAVGLRNISTRPITVTAVTFTTDQDRPGQPVLVTTTALPLVVQTSTRRSVDVLFRPPRAGAISGTVIVTCDDPDVPRVEVPLATAGTPLGAHGVLQVSATAADLGTVAAGQSAGVDITLTNTGDRALGIAGVRVVDAAPEGQFSVPLGAPASIDPGRSTQLRVVCRPTTRGRLTATLVVDARSATDTPVVYEQHAEVALSATATAGVVLLAGEALPPLAGPRPRIFRPGGDVARLVRDLDRLDFGAIAPGTSTSKPFWIRNIGDAPLRVTSIAYPNGPSFGIHDATVVPATIAPGGELAVTIDFTAPPAGATSSIQLMIDSDDPLRPRIELTATGRAAGGHLSSVPIDVLDLDGGMPPSGRVVLTSDGDASVTLRKVTVEVDRDFVVAAPPAPGTALAPGTTLALDVSYTGAAAGPHNAHLVVVTDVGTTDVLLRTVI